MNILLVVFSAYPETERFLSAAKKITSALDASTTALCVGSDVSRKYYSPFSIQLGKVDRGVERKIFEDIDRVFDGRGVSKMTRAGEPATQVLEEIEKGGYDMLLLEDADKKLTKKIAEYYHVPTYIFRRGEELSSFLACIDGGENSLRAAHFAGEMAKNLKAKLTLLSVIKSEAERSAAEEMLNKAKATLAEVSVDVEAIIRLGASVRQTILAEEKNHDVIALSPRGLSKIERLVLGHVSLHVLENAESSVLLVR